MATKSQKSKTRDGLLSSLDVAIDVLNLAKEISNATPAKAVFGSVGTLLAMIKVCSTLFRDDESPSQIYSGLHGQRRGLHRSWAALRRHL